MIVVAIDLGLAHYRLLVTSICAAFDHNSEEFCLHDLM